MCWPDDGGRPPAAALMPPTTTGYVQHVGLLRTCRERPRRRAADQGNELAPPHVNFSWLEVIAPLASAGRPRLSSCEGCRPCVRRGPCVRASRSLARRSTDRPSPVRQRDRLGAAVGRRGEQFKAAATVGLGAAAAVGLRHWRGGGLLSTKRDGPVAAFPESYR